MTLAITNEEKIKELLYRIFARGKQGDTGYIREYEQVMEIISQIKNEV